MSRYGYQPDEYDLERSHELERRLDRDEEREQSIYRAGKPRRRSRYFSGLMFRSIPKTAPVAPPTSMSYIAVREAPQGRVADGSTLEPDEGSAGARGGLRAAHVESTRGAGAGAVPGVAA